MKTYLTDIISKIQRFSKKLDDLTILTNKHWVVVDELMNSKSIYIFRSNNELIISFNGKVEKAKWEYLGNNSLLIDKKDDSYLFKHGFLDENVLALKVDSKEEYAFMVNENKYEGELNSFSNVIDFLIENYLDKTKSNQLIEELPIPHLPDDVTKNKETKIRIVSLETHKGVLKIITKHASGYSKGDKVNLNGKPAPDGKYSIGWLSMFNFITIKNGKIKSL